MPRVLIISPCAVKGADLAQGFQAEGFEILGPFCHADSVHHTAVTNAVAAAVVHVPADDTALLDLAMSYSESGIPIVVVSDDIEVKQSAQEGTAVFETQRDPGHIIEAVTELVSA